MNTKELLNELKTATDRDKKIKIISRLGKYAKGKVVEQVLLECLEREDGGFRASAVDALLQNSKKLVRKKIIEHLNDTDVVKMKCFEYVGFHKLESQTSMLIQSLDDGNFWIRFYAVLNLGAFRNEKNISVLRNHLEDEENDVVKSGCYLYH